MAEAEQAPSEWLNTVQVAHRLNVSLSFVRKVVKAGLLPAVDLSLGAERSEYRVHISEVKKFLEARRVVPDRAMREPVQK